VHQPLTEIISIETLDQDGALRETAAAVEGDTRAAFFRKGAIAGGTLLAGSVVMGGLPALASAATPSKKHDVAILNYALTLEYLEAAFYREAVAQGKFGGQIGTFAQLVSADEAAHVKTIKGVLGKAAVKSPKFSFGDTTTNQDKFTATAFALENTGVAAYSGQATSIKQTAVVKAAVSILTIEARHAAAIAALLGHVSGKDGITPNGAFDVAKSMSSVLKTVKATGFITG
jgi:Ferritin-like domain